MPRRSVPLIVLALSVAPLAAQDLTDVPKGPPPRLLTAMMGTAERILITQVALQYVPVQELRIEEKGGKKTEVKVTVQKAVPKPFRQSYKLKDVSFFGSDGKEIAPAPASAALQKPAGVVFSSDGNPVDPYYLRMIKEGTLVLVVPTNIQPMFEPLPKP